MLEALKQPRRMSLQHWRYRLLHWMHGRKPSASERPWMSTGLPSFLYTHYCPFFHYTNALVLALPFVALWTLTRLVASKISEPLRVVCGGVATVLWDAAQWFHGTALFVRLFQPRPLSEKDRYRRELDFVKLHLQTHWHMSVDAFVRYHTGPNSAGFNSGLIAADVQKIYEEYAKRFEELSLARKLRETRRRARFTACINASRLFFRCGINGAYIALGLGLLYTIYWVTPYTIPGFVFVGGWLWWLLLHSASIFWLTAKAVFVFAGAIACCVFFYRYAWVQKMVIGAVELLSPLFDAGCNGVGKACGVFPAIKEFFAMFYEDNCPPIVLVDDNDNGASTTALPVTPAFQEASLTTAEAAAIQKTLDDPAHPTHGGQQMPG